MSITDARMNQWKNAQQSRVSVSVAMVTRKTTTVATFVNVCILNTMPSVLTLCAGEGLLETFSQKCYH